MWGEGILAGMRITVRNMMREPMTVNYPHVKLELPDRARWAVAAKYDAEGKPRCTACRACVRACPHHVLVLDSTRRKKGPKHIDRYTYEVGACMMCGLCVEACSFDAIEMSRTYELACLDRKELTRDLLRDVDAAAVEQTNSPKPKRPAGRKRKRSKTADE